MIALEIAHYKTRLPLLSRLSSSPPVSRPAVVLLQLYELTVVSTPNLVMLPTPGNP